LAGALETLVTDRELASRMGAAGRGMVETEFSVETMARRTFAVYENLLGRPLGRA
jgi:glycosyltransferase involved in cell wall biosynthesis